MRNPYQYRTSGRSPIVFVALAVSAAALAFACSSGVHWIIMIPMAIAAVTCIVSIALNRTYGIDLDSHTLTIIAHKTRTPYSLDGIKEVVIKDWSDSTDIALQMHDGRTIPIHGNAAPPSNLFEKELKNRRVPVVRS